MSQIIDGIFIGILLGVIIGGVAGDIGATRKMMTEGINNGNAQYDTITGEWKWIPHKSESP